MGVKGIKVGKEMLDVFCLVDNKGVIHILNQTTGVGEVLKTLALKSSMNRLATIVLMGAS